MKIIEIVTGPIGPKGDPGASGSQGDSVFTPVDVNVYATTASLQITGSLTVSGSSTFTNIGVATFTGSATLNNYPILTSNDTGSFTTNAALNTFTASYYTDSASFNTKIEDNSSSVSLLSSSFLSFSGSYNTGSFTGSFTGDGSQLTGIVSSKWSGSNPITRASDVEITGSLRVVNGISGSFSGSGADLFNIPASAITGLNLSQISSGSVSASISPNSGLQVNTNVTATGFTGSLFGTSSWADNAISSSYAITASHATSVGVLTQPVTIIGNLDIIGTASFVYTTASQLDIGTNLISVNTNAAARFGGLAVIDSGSSPQVSGSLLFDSQNNQWIFVHENLGGATTSSVLIMGPQTFNNLGNETTITTNRLTKGTGGDLGEHIGDSNITDTGTLVSINSNTQITGSLVVNNGITASLQGTASYANNALSSSYSLTASYLDNYIPPFPYTGSALITGSLGVTGSVSVLGTTALDSLQDYYSSTGSSGQILTSDGNNIKWLTFKDSLQLQINSEGPTVTSGSKAYRFVDDEHYIEKITIKSTYTGSVEFILRDADIIYGSSSLNNNVLFTDTVLTGWTRTIPSGSLLEFQVGSAGGNSSGSASTFLFLINTLRKLT